MNAKEILTGSLPRWAVMWLLGGRLVPRRKGRSPPAHETPGRPRLATVEDRGLVSALARHEHRGFHARRPGAFAQRHRRSRQDCRRLVPSLGLRAALQPSTGGGLVRHDRTDPPAALRRVRSARGLLAVRRPPGNPDHECAGRGGVDRGFLGPSLEQRLPRPDASASSSLRRRGAGVSRPPCGCRSRFPVWRTNW